MFWITGQWLFYCLWFKNKPNCFPFFFTLDSLQLEVERDWFYNICCQDKIWFFLQFWSGGRLSFYNEMSFNCSWEDAAIRKYWALWNQRCRLSTRTCLGVAGREVLCAWKWIDNSTNVLYEVCCQLDEPWWSVATTPCISQSHSSPMLRSSVALSSFYEC